MTARSSPAPRWRARCPAALVFSLFAASFSPSAFAWIYTEHRDIAAEGIAKLSNEDRKTLLALWVTARTGHETRLCAQPAAGDQGRRPECVDFSAWPAIAGDHSCNTGDMLSAILESDWILHVARDAARANESLAKATREDQRRNALTRLDLDLERDDYAYSSRAGANNAHFLLARDSNDAVEYLTSSVKEGAPPNALAIYVLHHVAALRLARALAAGTVSEGKRPAVSRSLLAHEAFALHFLEDVYAAGHVAGTWGGVAERKGTHDFYNEHGLEVPTWAGELNILFGDGHMRPEDLNRAGAAVARSLAEVLSDLRGPASADGNVSMPAADDPSEHFDSCTATGMPKLDMTSGEKGELVPVLKGIPEPGRGEGHASLPRSRVEIGPFIGIATWAELGAATGGLDAPDDADRAAGSVGIAARLGVGLDALVGDSSDGQLFIQGGISLHSAERSSCTQNCNLPQIERDLLPRVPARTSLDFRARVPFWLIPGDLILAAPFLAFASPQTLKKMAITAANGGLIPWQTGLATRIGRFQFVLGREVAVSLYGYVGGPDTFFAYNGVDTSGQSTYLPVSLKSIEWDFPVLEYRPFRTFASRQTLSVFLQLGVGFDRPTQVRVLVPDQPIPPAQTRGLVFLRLAFDARNYF